VWLKKTREKKLELLADLKPEELENAIEMVRMDLVIVKLSDSAKKLYIEVFIETEISNSRVIIEDKQDNVVLIVVNGKPLKKRQFNKNIKKMKI